MNASLWLQAAAAASALGSGGEPAREDPWVVYEGGRGPGRGEHVVLVAGDEEYRSEEALPMLARILAVHHGFRCTVLFSTDPETRTIDPLNQTWIPGLEQVATADLLVLFLRFRELSDQDMKHIVEYLEAGKPVLGIRTATHAFDYRRAPDSPYARYGWRSSEWPGGFGRRILGETWVAHHGGHGSQSTRGVVDPAHADHPILRGVTDVWGPTDVYAVGELPADARVLLRGRVLAGMQPDSPTVEGPQNEPMMPLLWLREIEREGAPETMRVVCSTIGASADMQSAGLRRALVNACYWCMRLEDAIPEKSRVDYVGAFEPTPFGYGRFAPGVRAADLALHEASEPSDGD